MFQNALDQFRNNKIEKDSFLLLLSQLTDRQVMTYELLRSDIRNDIDRTLSQETIDEVGENISNPYYSLEKFK